MHSIPQRCARRPLSGGLVVPWVSLVHGGHAAFGSLDAGRARTAFLRRLCQICGQSLDERCYLIVRPADAARGHSPEPALHPECLPYAAAHCPMLNGTATHYRHRPVLATHPAGRPCTDPSCPCPPRSPDQGHTARSGSPADRYEAWMIHTRTYRPVFTPGRPSTPIGISVDVPVLRRRLLRTATLAPDQQRLMDLLRPLLGES
ncbi:cell envelope biogenesis protein OmpA [Streptomyces sp. MA15]|uniref:cell envelope biogenesis protein OmpA n=1 Tax=Streptomyces sp. MA15 TaxID=3055061 RepID=UPI0025AEEA6F|nr:cell envelope biogenesis protein OmpA [Streptomyces sp. MA15]MDN3271554.1 cell envelope biogenesis protein OmpA [Streptomyces sp. MA15]